MLNFINDIEQVFPIGIAIKQRKMTSSEQLIDKYL